MRCPNCGAEYPAPLPGVEPQLHCQRCNARLFAWLGDHFGQHNLDAAHDRPRGSPGLAWGSVAVLLVFFLLCWLCRVGFPS